MPILDELTPDSLPKVIFFDAMGTLFDLKSSAGEIYQQYASKYNVHIDAKQIQKAFINSFKFAPELAFSSPELGAIKQQEFAWWKQVVLATFKQLEMLESFSSFNDFFTEIYFYFGTKEPWYVFPDTVDCLTKCRDRQIELGVISNFDSRLIEVLNLLDLNQFFKSITISSRAGFAKPNPKIFQAALSKHNLAAYQAWHIGDHPTEDYTAAKNAGLESFWLNRSAYSLNIQNQLPNLWSLG